jgi:hypothetical protein
MGVICRRAVARARKYRLVFIVGDSPWPVLAHVHFGHDALIKVRHDQKLSRTKCLERAMKRALSSKADGSEFSPVALPAGQKRKQPFARDDGWTNSINGAGQSGSSQHKRRGFLVWSAEKMFLGGLFVAALLAGWFASTWLWKIDFTGIVCLLLWLVCVSTW